MHLRIAAFACLALLALGGQPALAQDSPGGPQPQQEAGASPFISEHQLLLDALRLALRNWDAVTALPGFAGWDARTEPCTWTGVSCNSNGAVERM
jgi:hypothetical protein